MIESKKAKQKKDTETIAMLRAELSSVRQLKNKLSRREYNRKSKHQKTLERRRRRREYILKQVSYEHLHVLDATDAKYIGFLE